MSDKPLHILFVCTGNSCRSQMAEGWARTLGGERVVAESSGIEAHGKNPRAIAVMGEAGGDISRQASTQLDDAMLARADLVVTVCGHADEHCPVLPEGTRKIHWPLQDPAKATGTDEEIMAEFRRVRDEIRERVSDLLRAEGIEPQAFDASPKLVPGNDEFHISLRVADLAESTAFYTRLFGIQPKDREARYSTFIVPWLKLNFVLLVNDSGEKLDTYSLYHLGLRVPDKDAVIAAYHTALAAGTEVVKPPRSTWHGFPLHELWLRDPTGYLLEIYAEMTPEELAEMPADKEPTFLVPGTEPATA